MFYYERKRMGVWSPEKTDERPTGKQTDGAVYQFQNVHELRKELAPLPLDVLFEIFNPKGSEKPLTETSDKA